MSLFTRFFRKKPSVALSTPTPTAFEQFFKGETGFDISTQSGFGMTAGLARGGNTSTEALDAARTGVSSAPGTVRARDTAIPRGYTSRQSAYPDGERPRSSAAAPSAQPLSSDVNPIAGRPVRGSSARNQDGTYQAGPDYDNYSDYRSSINRHGSTTHAAGGMGWTSTPPGTGYVSSSGERITAQSLGGGSLGGIAALGMIGTSALGGGLVSYGTGGEFGQGAMMGAIGGAAIGMGAPRLAGLVKNQAQKHKMLQGPGFSSAMTSVANAGSTSGGRAAMFGSGALLGGFGFGGQRSHKRGFNQNRGNGFGH